MYFKELEDLFIDDVKIITDMKIKTIDDDNTDFNRVELKDSGNIGRKTPHCKVHGAMNKVSKFKDRNGGYWRCNALGGCRAGCIEES